MENTAQAAGQAGPAPPDTLKVIRRDFPHFRIWRELTGDRTRYIARRQQAVRGPHTVVTADRDAACSILDDFPEVAQAARANREFVTRAVHYTATQAITQAITQYIDIGAGLPTSPAAHETAQQASPAARVAYVDNLDLNQRSASCSRPCCTSCSLAKPTPPSLHSALPWPPGATPPGLVDVQSWHPGIHHHWLTPHTARILAAVARKPARAGGTIPPALPKRQRRATA